MSTYKIEIPFIKRIPLLPCFIILYLFLPFCLFLVGWTKLYVSIPILLILCYSFIRMAKSFPKLWLPALSKSNLIKIGLIFVIIWIWVVLSGTGKFVWQNEDHYYRNGIFDILVNEKWPIIYSSPPYEYFSRPVAFVYYFGFWLPSAIVGKLFGIAAGRITQAIWAMIGIFLFYYLVIAKYIKKIVFWPLLVFILFSGLDTLGIIINGNASIIGIEHIEWWASPFQFSSMTTQQFWVFNQSLPSWLALMMLLIQKNNRFVVIILALSMITSTLPFVGLAIIALCVIVNNMIAEKNSDKMTIAKNLFTFENLVGGGAIGILSFLFFIGNNEIANIGLIRYDQFLKFLLFYLLEVGCYLIVLYRSQKQNYLYYLSAICLFLYPWIDIGRYHDFGMRATIPFLVVVYLLVIDTINKNIPQKKYEIIVVLIIMLAIGSLTPLREITRTISMTASRIRNHQPVYIETIYPMESPERNSSFGYIDDNFFFKYLAKKPKDINTENNIQEYQLGSIINLTTTDALKYFTTPLDVYTDSFLHTVGNETVFKATLRTPITSDLKYK